MKGDSDSLTLIYPLAEVTVSVAGRDWRLTAVTDQDALVDRIRTEEDLNHFPYGLMLWGSAIGLSARLAVEAEQMRGKRVLEIGAGIGVVGLTAAYLGASVVQTDYLEPALSLCRHNAAVNGISGIETRIGDWRDWPDDLVSFPVVLGSDILYERSMHPLLLPLLPRLVAPGGTLLLSDPLRPQALDFVEQAEATKRWTVTMEPAQVRFEGQTKDLAIFRLSLTG